MGTPGWSYEKFMFQNIKHAENAVVQMCGESENRCLLLVCRRLFGLFSGNAVAVNGCAILNSKLQCGVVECAICAKVHTRVSAIRSLWYNTFLSY